MGPVIPIAIVAGGVTHAVVEDRRDREREARQERERLEKIRIEAENKRIRIV